MTNLYLKNLKKFMNKEKLDFFIVHDTDEFLNEYIELKENSRFFVTNFSGSTGNALVTKDKTYLFVDGRYHLQADNEVNSGDTVVVKVQLNESPQTLLIEKIKELKGLKGGLVNKKISHRAFKKLQEELESVDIKLKEYDKDPVIKSVKSNKVNALLVDSLITGLSAEEKLDNLLNNMNLLEVDAFFISKLDEIAYMTNLRSFEIACNSTFKAYCLVANNSCYVFTDVKVSKEIKQKLGKRFIFAEKKKFEKDIKQLIKKSLNIGLNSAFTTLYAYRMLEKTKKELKELEQSPISIMKSIKTDAETQHLKECFRKTDIVVSRAITWLNQSLEKGFKITEKAFSDKVEQAFIEEGAKALSFKTIAASGKNTAFIHYSTPSNEKEIKDGELVLLDCGAYFEGGYATDITRTFFASSKYTQADEKLKEIYTKVLKALLNGLYFNLEQANSGFDIDAKVRQVVTEGVEGGFKFSHGTGHGVGINVHDFPPAISPSEKAKAPLQEGMVFTIEPGLYNDDWGGVRLENTVTVKNIDGKLKICSLAHSKFDEKLINYDILTEQEKEWLKGYNRLSL